MYILCRDMCYTMYIQKEVAHGNATYKNGAIVTVLDWPVHYEYLAFILMTK